MQTGHTLRENRPLASAEDEAEMSLLERRWFAAHRRAELMRANCDLLRQVTELAHADWRSAESQLAEVETVRDVLAREYELSILREGPADPGNRTVAAPAA